MLTRLKVSGFKNLVDVDVRLGPFTCIAGPNGAGKSNLFDAIRFLSALADQPLVNAAMSEQGTGGRISDVRSLFHRVGDRYDPEMSFEVEMIVPQKGRDDLGQEAIASITFLRYSLTLAYRVNDVARAGLAIVKEELAPMATNDSEKQLPFATQHVEWLKTAVIGERESAFISTIGTGSDTKIQVHPDREEGKTRSYAASELPRTVLSVSNAADSPTALLARREMQAWQVLQLEPSALRRPASFTDPARLGPDGSHLASTLYRLAQPHRMGNGEMQPHTASVYSHVANLLSSLIDDVRSVSVDRDEKRELLTLLVTGRDHTTHSARALSDGTLRFLALAVLEHDPDIQSLLCVEEPENGLHPKRIRAMLGLLRDIATDVKWPVGDDNPLRQVIINTHSPTVIEQVPEDSLLFTDLREMLRDSKRFPRAVFSYLPKTWREDTANREGQSPRLIAKGNLLTYLNPVPHLRQFNNGEESSSKPARVIDRKDVQELMQLALPLKESSE